MVVIVPRGRAGNLLRCRARCRSRARTAIHSTLVPRGGARKGKDDLAGPGHVELLPRLLLDSGGILASEQVNLLLELLVFLLKAVGLVLEQAVLPLLAAQGQVTMLTVDYMIA